MVIIQVLRKIFPPDGGPATKISKHHKRCSLDRALQRPFHSPPRGSPRGGRANRTIHFIFNYVIHYKNLTGNF